MKRLLAVLVSALLLATALAGCAKSGTGESSSKGESSKVDESGKDSKIPEVLDLKVYRPIFSEISPQGLAVEEKWHEMMDAYMGCKVNVIWEEVSFGDYLDKLSVYLASGDWADVYMISGNQDQIGELGSTGMLLAQDDYMDYIPHYGKYLQDKNEKRKTVYPDGRMYAFGDLSVSNIAGTQGTFAIRFDAFKDNNIPIPTTLDELYSVAKKFKELYPKSYPISGSGNDMLAAMYGINHTGSSRYFDGEKFVYGPTDGKLKDMVAFLQKLCKEGLLDPEYATQTGENFIEKTLNDKAFIAPFLYTLALSDNINGAKKGNVEWGAIPHPKNSAVSDVPWYPIPLFKGASISMSFKTVVNAKTKYPEAVMKVVDYQYSDEMIDLANYGVEGVTYNVTDGEKIYVDEILKAENPMTAMSKYGINACMSVRSGIQFMPQLPDTFMQTFPPVPTWLNGEYGSMTSWQFYNDVEAETDLTVAKPTEPVVVLTTEEAQLQTDIMTPVNTFVTENIAKFIAGELDMGEWDSFVEQIKGYGDYTQIIDMYNKKMAE